MGAPPAVPRLGMSSREAYYPTRSPLVAVNSRPPHLITRERCLQGRVRTKTVKRSSRHVIEKYYNKLGVDFDTNKRVLDEVAVVQSKVSYRGSRAAAVPSSLHREWRGPAHQTRIGSLGG